MVGHQPYSAQSGNVASISCYALTYCLASMYMQYVYVCASLAHRRVYVKCMCHIYLGHMVESVAVGHVESKVNRQWALSVLVIGW